jgi:hydrogenase expression/formation protein HypE
MLGLDPLEITCEGKAVMIVSAEDSENILMAVKGTKYGENAEIVGEVRYERPGMVLLKTVVGGTRLLRKPLSEPIPRVC